jgi:nucleoside-diphosphate-sugar epimerase
LALDERSAPSQLDLDRWLIMREKWTQTSLEDHLATAIERRSAQRVLVICRFQLDAEMMRKAVAGCWAENAHKVLINVLLLPGDRTEGAQLVSRWLERHGSQDAVFHFARCADAVSELPEHFASVLDVIKSLSCHSHNRPLKYFYCYTGASAVAAVFEEGLSGLLRSAAMENVDHRYQSVELPQSAALPDYISLIKEWMLSRPARAAAQIPMVRYRNGLRYETRVAEIELEATGSTTFKRGATYLIVGGLGEVGELVCGALAEALRPHLVILGRRPLEGAVQGALARIAAAGARVTYRSADITDRAQLAECLDEVRPHVGPINGVIHLARSVSDARLSDKSFESFKQTTAAKTIGSLNVDQLTAREPLDFFIMYSSMASFGIEGSADYAYSTAFQNAFARSRNEQIARGERSGKTVALCWGQWNKDAYLTEGRRALLKMSGFALIGPDAILPAMNAALRSPEDVVCYIAVDNKDHVKKLYGLEHSEDAHPDSDVLDNAVSSIERPLADVLELDCGATSAEDIERKLRDRPYGELLELFEALAN